MIKRLLPLSLILLIAVLLSPILRRLVREIIVIPVLYVFWIGRFVFEAIPQVALWGCFLILVVLILIGGLVGRRRSRPTPVPSIPDNRASIEDWANLIQKAEHDDYYKWRLAQRLQKLALQTIATSERQSLKQTRQQLRRGELDMPAEVQAYFQASLQPLGHLPTPKRFLWPKNTASALDIDPGQIILYLESLNANVGQFNISETT